MNPEEAKLILQCRRPCGRDDHDAAIQEALAMLGTDTTAMEVLRQEERLDAVIGERLRCIETPVDLRRKILAGAKLSPRVKPWWQRPRWLAAAAAVAVAIPVGLKYLPVSRPGNPPLIASVLTDFRIDTTKKLNDGPSLALLPTIDEVKAHLADHSTTKTVPLPTHLCDCTDGTVGCEVFEWRGKEVTLICFKAGKNGVVHLFTVDASVLDAFPAKAVCVPVNGWQTRAWVQDGKLMLLAGGEKEATEEDLKSLVE